MEYINMGKFSKLVGIPMYKLRKWDKDDIFKPAHKAKSGHRYYTQDQVMDFFEKTILVIATKIEDYEAIDNQDLNTYELLRIENIEELIKYLISMNDYKLLKLEKIVMIKPIDIRVKKIIHNLGIKLEEISK
jgi:DNA-binding transcriptional MerR regulator